MRLMRIVGVIVACILGLTAAVRPIGVHVNARLIVFGTETMYEAELTHWRVYDWGFRVGDGTFRCRCGEDPAKATEIAYESSLNEARAAAESGDLPVGEWCDVGNTHSEVLPTLLDAVASMLRAALRESDWVSKPEYLDDLRGTGWLSVPMFSWKPNIVIGAVAAVLLAVSLGPMLWKRRIEPV